MKRSLAGVLSAVLFAVAMGAHGAGVQGVGNTNVFPRATKSGTPIELQLWQWGEGQERKLLAMVEDGTQIPFQRFTTNAMSIRFRVAVDHDTIFCRVQSSDQVPSIGWGPSEVVPYDGAITSRVYRFIH